MRLKVKGLSFDQSFHNHVQFKSFETMSKQHFAIRSSKTCLFSDAMRFVTLS